VNHIFPNVSGNVSLPLATGFSDVLPTTNGGTGNGDGYIRTGKKANTLIGTASTIEGQDNEGAGSFGHVEGKDNSIPAGVSYAHVGGVGNTAHVTGASVIGKYAANYGSYNTPLFAVGNGTAANAKSSAFHINMDGSAQVAGNLYKGAAFNTAPSNGFVSASNIADVKEATRTMTALRAKGKHIYVVADDLTYEVTADAGIPANGTLIPDTNAVVWTAAGGYETISSDLTDINRVVLTSSGSDYTIYANQNYPEPYYLKRAGFCFVSLCFTCVTSKSNWTQICTLPMAAAYNMIMTPSAVSIDDGTSIPLLFIGDKLYVKSGTASKVYAVSFVYPSD
jgi:hypothetical protein